MDIRERILTAAIVHHGEWEAIARTLRDNLPLPFVKLNCQAVTIADAAYPDSLRQLRFPPWVLFYNGRLELLDRLGIGIVGSRSACQRGLVMTAECCRELRDEIIVSGLAKGIDACAHRTCLKLGMKTVGIAGCGLDRPYPAVNRSLYEQMGKQQLILSEYPPGTPPLRHHFPWRNRLIAALSRQLLVMQADYRSGTMSTVNEALELGREVWCVPYPEGETEGRGCNLLIEQGARSLICPAQLRKEALFHRGNKEFQ